MNIRKIITLLLLSLTIILQSGFALTDTGFNYLNFYEDNTSSKNKISYELTKSQFSDLATGDKFRLDIYFDDAIVDDSCSKAIEFKETTFYKKITCEIDKLGPGNYVFVGQILRDDKIINKVITKQIISNSGTASLNYKILENSTQIEIQVDSNSENLKIINTIPKEIIAKITEETKTQLINSKQDFEIIESDPIIAWNIDKAPKTIEYEINSKANIKDLENMEIELQEQTSYTYLTYILYTLIIIIILVLLKPIFKKNKTKQKQKK